MPLHKTSDPLDYKKELPKGLSKHFATFSNTLGGVIIVGVEEDPQTGLPLKWEGVDNDGKLLERANQFAANVNPLPSYSVRLTDEVNGKVFLLISILEGDAPPYFTNGDPTVWLRTGNISKPLRPADREELVRMVEKKKSAESMRGQNLTTAEAVFGAALRRAEIERKRNIEEAEKAGKSHMLPTTPLGQDGSLLTISLQPFYPKHSLAEPWEIKGSLRDLETRSAGGGSLPSQDMEPIPDGLASTMVLHTFYDSKIIAYQIHGNGLVFYKEDIRHGSNFGDKNIYIGHMADAIWKLLIFSRKFYAKYNYSGILVGNVDLKNALGADVHTIVPDGWRDFSFRRHQIDKLNDYSWSLELDTHIIGDDALLLEFFKAVLRKVYWSLGIESMQNDAVELFLKQRNWN